MPYSSVADLPDSVKERVKSAKKQRQWLHVWNSSYDRHKDESRAFAEANSVVAKAASDNVDVHFFLPLTKIDVKKRTVSGYASTPCLDSDGEKVTLDAIKAALPNYWQYRNIREMHLPSAVGTAQEANVDGKGLFLTAKIVDDAAWKKVEEGVYKGFSLGGRKLAKSGREITKIDLVEISIVDRPANPECRFDVQKSASPTAEAYLLPAPPERSPSAKALRKMAQAVTILAEQTPDTEKREFTSEERKGAASSGAAMSDGSFPIENKKDLKNAVRAIGRAKDPDAAKRHIKGRAKALGLQGQIPPEWTKKFAKRMAKLAKSQQQPEPTAKEQNTERSTDEPSFLTLTVDGRSEAAGGDVEIPAIDLDVERAGPVLQKGGLSPDGGKKSKKGKLKKRMSVAGQLAYCFDSIRDAQRSLLREAKIEGGDERDKALAAKLGDVAKNLAGVIGQKADHEGQEALDFSDADDQALLSIYGEDFFNMATTKTAKTTTAPDALVKVLMSALQKNETATSPAAMIAGARQTLKEAKSMRKAASAEVQSAFELVKSRYLARKAIIQKNDKKNDGDEDDVKDMEKVLRTLQKAHGALLKQKEGISSASATLKKAQGHLSMDGEVTDPEPGVFKVPEGITELSVEDLEKAIKIAKESVKEETGDLITPREAEALVRAAAAEAESRLLKSMPASGGRQPYRFDLSKLAGGNGGGEPDPVADFFKGAKAENLASENDDIRQTEIAKAIGSRILGGKGGKTVFDPAFHGTAGGGTA